MQIFSISSFVDAAGRGSHVNFGNTQGFHQRDGFLTILEMSAPEQRALSVLTR